MKLFRYIYEQTRAMALVFLLFLPPFGLLFYYTSLNVETALLRRKVKRLKHRKELLIKKNAALREAIMDDSRKEIFPEDSGGRRLQNKIVRIRLNGESGKGDGY